MSDVLLGKESAGREGENGDDDSIRAEESCTE